MFGKCKFKMTKAKLSRSGRLRRAPRIGDFFLLDKLGDGFSGSVYLAKSAKSGETVAVKIPTMDPNRAEDPKILELIGQEFFVLSQLEHPNIIKPVDFKKRAELVDPKGNSKAKVPFLAIEAATKGEFCELLVETGRLPQEAALFYFRQLLSVLEYLHSKGLAHRDIKPENMLLDENLDLKVIDFAFACPMSTERVTRMGTESYFPPEAFVSPNFDLRKADFFAAGVVLFIMLTGIPPFSDSKPSDPHFRLFSSNPELFWQYQKKIDPSCDFSQSLKSLVQGLLEQDPFKRWGTQEIAANEWFNVPVNEQRVKEHMKRVTFRLKEIKKV